MGALNPDLPVLTPGATLLEKDDEKNSRMNLETPKSGKMPENLSADLPSLRASSAAAAAGELPTQVITPPPTQVSDLPAVRAALQTILQPSTLQLNEELAAQMDPQLFIPLGYIQKRLAEGSIVVPEAEAERGDGGSTAVELSGRGTGDGATTVPGRTSGSVLCGVSEKRDVVIPVAGGTTRTAR